MSKYLLYYVITLIINLLHIVCYKEISNTKKINITIPRIIVLLVVSIFVMLNSYLNTSVYKPIISLSLLLILYFYTFRNQLYETISYGTISYLLTIISEIIISILFVIFKIFDMSRFNSNMILKFIFSIIILILTYLGCKNKYIKKISNKLCNIIKKSKFILIVLFFSMCIPIILDFKYVNNISTLNYIMNVILLVIFSFFIMFSIYYEIKASNEMEKYENLLNNITRYEKLIDEYRINKHEIHNNLLILKSYKNKNSKEYDNILNDMIDNYSKNDISIKNMSKLPSGIKGIIYYKLFNNKKINYNINISKNLNLKIDKSSKEYVNLCKLFTIILDNAIEASLDSKDKIMIIDIYEENNKYVISICNSFNKNKTNINKINELHYSTKGKNRGFGLFIAKRIISDSKCIHLKQSIDNDLFISEIHICK